MRDCAKETVIAESNKQEDAAACMTTYTGDFVLAVRKCLLELGACKLHSTDSQETIIVSVLRATSKLSPP